MKNHPFAILVFCAVLGASSLSLLPTAFAQDDPPADPASTETEKPPPPPSNATILDLIKQGGITMFPLGMLSIACVTFAIRNLLALKKDKLIPPQLVAELGQQMASHDLAGAMQTCNANPCLLTAVVGAGLERVTGDELDMENIKSAIDDADTEQMVTYMTPISYLSIIGAVSPMVGLLGTVSGMIKAFKSISSGGMGKPEVLAGNIGEALVTTATGLIIAIPSMIFYFIFKNKFLQIMANMGRINGTLLDALQTGELADYTADSAEGEFVEEGDEEFEEDA